LKITHFVENCCLNDRIIISWIERIGLETELEFNGLYKVPYTQIILNLEWEESK